MVRRRRCIRKAKARRCGSAHEASWEQAPERAGRKRSGVRSDPGVPQPRRGSGRQHVTGCSQKIPHSATSPAQRCLIFRC